MRNTGPARAFTQAQAFDTQFPDNLINSFEQGTPQIAMMVSVGGFLRYGHDGRHLI